MEDQKKTDTIKNIRTVLPPLNLKKVEKKDQEAMGDRKSDRSEPDFGETAGGARDTHHSPPRSESPQKEPPNVRGTQGIANRPPGPERHAAAQPAQQPMQPPVQRYRVHTTTSYAPYNPYAKTSLGYPPGRHPPHTQTRYYPPPKQYIYSGEIQGPREIPKAPEKAPEKAPPQLERALPHGYPQHAPHMPPQGHPDRERERPHLPPVGHIVHGGQSGYLAHPSPKYPGQEGVAPEVQVHDAMRYLSAVKEEYKHNKEVYKRFLKTLKEYKERQIDAKTVVDIVLSLFSGNQKLLQGFNQFLPKKYEILSSGEVKVHEEKEAEQKDEQDSDKNREDASRQRDPRDMGRDIGRDIGRDVGRGEYSRGDFQRSDNEEYDRHQREAERKRENKQIDRRLARNELEGSGIDVKTAHSDREGRDESGRVIAYLNKVRKHLEGTPAAWFEFLRIVQSYKRFKSEGRADSQRISEILASVKTLLKDAPSLVEEFLVFLPGHGETERGRHSSERSGDAAEMLHDIKGVLVRKGVYREFIKALNMFNQGLLSSSSLLLVIEPFLKPSPALYSLFRYYIGHRETEAPPFMQANLETYKKMGSYRVLPEKYRSSSHSGQSAEDASVLNVELVSCPTFSSESSAFVFAKKNIYEESLFRVENERYEADLLIERVSALIQKLSEHEEIALDEINAPQEAKDARDAREEASPKEEQTGGRQRLQLSAVDKEVLNAVYESATDEIILGLIAHPIRAIPVVMKQLRKTESQWVKSRVAYAETWRVTVERNFLRALDVKGYKIRNGERKTPLSKQFTKDIESASEVEFWIPDRYACERVVEILGRSVEPEEESQEEQRLRAIRSIIGKERVLFVTHEMYLVLRAVASICSRVADALGGRKRDLSGSEVAERLGAQKKSEVLTKEEVFALLEEYVLGKMETHAFEEQIFGGLGVAAASLIGISGIFQSLEVMFESVGANRMSGEIIARIEEQEKVQEKNVSELLQQGPLVKITVEKKGEGLICTAKKINAFKSSTSGWSAPAIGEAEKNGSEIDAGSEGDADADEDRANGAEDRDEEEVNDEEVNGDQMPFLRRTLRNEKSDVTYGIEPLVEESPRRIRLTPGTEDFAMKRRKEDGDEGEDEDEDVNTSVSGLSDDNDSKDRSIEE